MKNLKEIAVVFLKLGVFAFGGPAAHIAMMEDEAVTKRKWMSREHFLDLVGATNLIPGPNSTEMAIHCGLQRGGWLGLLVSGFCFISPAVIITTILAHIYYQYGKLPAIEPFFIGLAPAVIAVIIGAVLKLGKKANKNNTLLVIGCIACAAVLLGLSEILVILGGGIIGMIWLSSMKKFNVKTSVVPLGIPLAPAWLIGTGTLGSVGAAICSQIFFVFLKIGFILFGSGYVLVAYLQGELVEKLNWISEQVLLDSIAVGQLTPGPVLTTSTFVGYQLAGIEGALAATVGMFLPSFLLVAILNPIVPKLRQWQWTACFLDSVNICAVGVMAAVTIQFLINFLSDIRLLIIAICSIILHFFIFKLSAVKLVLLGAGLGYLLTVLF